MNYVNHGSARRLARRILGSEKMKMGGIYLMFANEYKGEIFCDGKAKLLDFLDY
jgi:hypothetical protein